MQEETVQRCIQIKSEVLGKNKEDQKKTSGLKQDQNKGEKVRLGSLIGKAHEDGVDNQNRQPGKRPLPKVVSALNKTNQDVRLPVKVDQVGRQLFRPVQSIKTIDRG